ncbi:MAG: chemotaxis protein CheX [Mariprofundaceae bacterium]
MILNDEQRDLITELVNVGVGRAASTLNSLIGHHIMLQVPQILVLNQQEMKQYTHDYDDAIATVTMPFHGPFIGNAALIFPQQSASTLVAVLTDESPNSTELDAVRAGTLTEIGNILINAVIGSMGNMLDANIEYSLPDYMEGSMHDFLNLEANRAPAVLVAQTTFSINELEVKGDFMLFFDVASFDTFIEAIN